MRLSLKQHDHEYAIETVGDDQSLDEMCQYLKQLLLSAGYSFSGEVVILEEDND